MSQNNPNSYNRSTRRRWLTAAALTGAVGVTNGWVWYRQQHASVGQSITTNDIPPDNFWLQTFPTPTGGSLAMARFKGKPLVLNFWATWCPPCIKEMPLLNQFAHDMLPKGWRVIGLAIDQAFAVQKFLSHTPVQFDIAVAGDNGIHLAFQLGNAAGGLPFSVVLNTAGQVKIRKLGPAHPEDFAHWATLENMAE